MTTVFKSFDPSPPTRSLVAAIVGESKVGKSFWALGGQAPDDPALIKDQSGLPPVYLIAIDPNSMRTAKKVAYTTHRDIRYLEFPFEPGLELGPGRERWKRLMDAIYGCIAVNDGGVIVVDSEFYMAKMGRLALVGSEDQVALGLNRRMDLFGNFNDSYSAVIQAAQNSRMSLLFLQQYGDTYEDRTNEKGQVESNKTGGREIKGWAHMNYAVESNIVFTWDQNKLGTDESPYLLYLGNHAQNMDLAGQWFNRGKSTTMPGYVDFHELLYLTFGPE